MDLAFCKNCVRSFICSNSLLGRGKCFLQLIRRIAFKNIFIQRKGRNFVFFLLFCITSSVSAQFDPIFSQSMFNPINGNPGFAGLSGRMNVILMNRNQWTGLEGAPVTTVAGGDVAVNVFEKRAGIGLEIINDDIGLYNNLMVRTSISRRYLLSEGELGVGISAAILNQSFDGTGTYIPESDYHQQTDPLVPNEKVSVFTPDFGMGAFYKGEIWYAGIGIQHLFAPEPNFQEDFYVYIHRTLFLSGGYTLKLEERNFDLAPSVFFRQGGGSWQADFNVNLHFRDKYWAGITYRYQDAVVILGGIVLGNGIRAGYSYDITTSDLSRAGSYGSHELAIGYTFDLNINRQEKRYKSVRFL
jgi:type IX secretion system PorP/SprF family membrane protein